MRFNILQRPRRNGLRGVFLVPAISGGFVFSITAPAFFIVRTRFAGTFCRAGKNVPSPKENRKYGKRRTDLFTGRRRRRQALPPGGSDELRPTLIVETATSEKNIFVYIIAYRSDKSHRRRRGGYNGYGNARILTSRTPVGGGITNHPGGRRHACLPVS